MSDLGHIKHPAVFSGAIPVISSSSPSSRLRPITLSLLNIPPSLHVHPEICQKKSCVSRGVGCLSAASSADEDRSSFPLLDHHPLFISAHATSVAHKSSRVGVERQKGEEFLLLSRMSWTYWFLKHKQVKVNKGGRSAPVSFWCSFGFFFCVCVSSHFMGFKPPQATGLEGHKVRAHTSEPDSNPGGRIRRDTGLSPETIPFHSFLALFSSDLIHTRKRGSDGEEETKKEKKKHMPPLPHTQQDISSPPAEADL